MTKIKVAVLTSGGDAPGMNAAIRSVILAAHHFKLPTIGFYSGFNGLIDDNSIELTPDSVNGIIHQGGTILKSARCPAMLNEQGLKEATNTLVKENITALIVIGGDGSFNGLLALKEYWSGQVIGIPGTIDNDIDGTDFTIGFSTAVNTGIEAIDKIRDTAEAFERIFIVELMGRRSGHITFNVGIACAAEQILSFENFSQDDEQEKLNHLAQEIKQAQHNRHASYIIVIAENLWRGGAAQLAKQLKETAGIDCTACILGYIQRGGSPVAKDRILATKMGVAAIQELIAGNDKVMIAERNNQLLTTPLSIAVLQNEKVSENLIFAQENILAITAQ